MCTVSMIGDHFYDQWKDFPYSPQPFTPQPNSTTTTILNLGPTKEEFDNLKKEVEIMKGLLKRAKIYDEETGQKDCEMEEKIEFLKKMAEFVGVDLEEIFGKK